MSGRRDRTWTAGEALANGEWLAVAMAGLVWPEKGKMRVGVTVRVGVGWNRVLIRQQKRDPESRE